MATLDVTEKVNVLVDAIGWEGFCEELMARMDEDALDAVRLRPYRTALRRGACGESLCSLKTRRSAAGQSTE